MSIDNEDKEAIEALVTAVGTTEASFRTGMSHIIDHVDTMSTPKDDWYNSSGNYTTPSGVNKVLITGVGGGGGGGSGKNNTNANGSGAGGGAGGMSLKREVTVSPSTTYAVTIGAGGVKAANGTENDGGVGGSTTFVDPSNGNLLTLGGGAGGHYISGGGAGGTVTGGSGGAVVSGDVGLNSGYGNYNIAGGLGGTGWNVFGKESGGLSFGDGGQGGRSGSNNNISLPGNSGFILIEVGE